MYKRQTIPVGPPDFAALAPGRSSFFIRTDRPSSRESCWSGTYTLQASAATFLSTGI